MNPSMQMNMAPPERMSCHPRPGLFVAMILGFIFCWPVGLAILAYIIWSSRMGCGFGPSAWGEHRQERMARKMARLREKMERWGVAQPAGFAPTGNHAFDEYRTDTLRRLEEEAAAFRDFLDRLRHARDKAQFDQFMDERRSAQGAPRPAAPNEAETGR